MLQVLDEIVEENFKNERSRYPYNEWERKRNVVKERLRNLSHYIKKASAIAVVEGPGRPSKMSLEQKTILFLFARMMNKSNRDMESILVFLQPFFSEEVSYKTIERLYSDEGVTIVLHNLFILLMEDNKPTGDFAGDGTGYSLSVTQHYRSAVKKSSKKYRYVFRLIDVQTGLYVCFGYSERSEKDAFNKAMHMLKKLKIEVNTNRLDRYYSNKTTIRLFGKKVALYLIPKKGMKVGIEWYRLVKELILDPVGYLKEYFKRNLTETGISSDKRRFGWIVRQKREDRRENAMFAITLLHNIFFVRLLNS